jgi:integrase
VPLAKRAEYEREWRHACAWADSIGVKFPWAAVDARDYAVQVLREHGVEITLTNIVGRAALTSVPSKIRSVGRVGNKVNETTFHSRMAAVDSHHVSAGFKPPWQSAKIVFEPWWKRMRRLYLTRQKSEAKDALLLPDLLIILHHLKQPDLRSLRDAALMAVAGDPTLSLDNVRATRPEFAYLTAISTSDVVLHGDGSVELRAPRQRGFATVLIEPGVAAAAVRRLVLWQQPQHAVGGELMFDHNGAPVRDLDSWGGPLFPSLSSNDCERHAISRTGVRHVLEDIVAGYADPSVVFPMVGNKRVLALPAELIRIIVRDLDGPSLEAARDAAWLANAWWLGARGMEALGRQWADTNVVDAGVEWNLPRKADSTGKRVKYATPHLSLTFADPKQCLIRYRRKLDIQHRAASGRPLSESDPIFPPDLSEPTEFCDRPDVFSHRLQALATSLGIPGDFASHSLRSGCANSLRELGVPDEKIMVHLDWVDWNQYRAYFRVLGLHDTSAAVMEGAIAAGIAKVVEPDQREFKVRLRRIVEEALAAGEGCTCAQCSEQLTVEMILGVSQTMDSDNAVND